MLKERLSEVMARKKLRSVFQDLLPEDQATEMEMHAQLLNRLHRWLTESGLTQAGAARVLRIKQARVLDLKRGKISRLSLDLLVRLATRVGLHPRMTLAA